MKYVIPLIAILGLAGCSTAPQNKVESNAGSFLKTLGDMDISATDVTQKTMGPFYNHQESAVAFNKTSTGFTVAKLYAELNIPFPVFGIPLLHWEFGASNITGNKHPSDTAASLQAPVTSPATIMPLIEAVPASTK